MDGPRLRSSPLEERPSVVFWGKDIAFFASSLTRLLTEVGVDAVDLTGPYDQGRAPKYPDPLRLRVVERKLRAAALVLGGANRTCRTSLHRSTATVLSMLAGSVRSIADLCTVLWIGLRFDTLVLTWASSVSGHRYEYALYRLLGCRTVLVLHGTEARPPYLNGALFPADRPVDVSKVARETDVRWERMRRAQRGVDLIVGFPGVAHFFSRPVLDRELLGFPIGVSADPRRIQDRRDGSPPTVLHAPSRASAKGTVPLRAMVDRLHAEGLRFDVDWSTEWRSHEDVLDAVRRADIVLDQLFADVPGATLAREAMALGAVPIVGSPVARWLTDRYEGSGAAVAVVRSPEDVEATLRRLITDSEERERQRAAALTVMETSQSPEAIVGRWVSVLFEEPDPAHFFDPLEIDTVVHGFAPTDHLRAVTRALVAECGPAGLGLDHNPGLLAAVLEFAGESTEPSVSYIGAGER